MCCQTISCSVGYIIDWFVSYTAFEIALSGFLWAPADPEKVVFALQIYIFYKFLYCIGAII